MIDHPLVLEEPEASVWLDSIDTYAMNIHARCYTKNENYYPVIWNNLEDIKKALDKNGIKVQVPKQEITYSSNEEMKMPQPKN